jgi:hypothetical protein
VLETALDAERTEHLGYDRHDPAGLGGGCLDDVGVHVRVNGDGELEGRATAAYETNSATAQPLAGADVKRRGRALSTAPISWPVVPRVVARGSSRYSKIWN